MNDEFNVKSSTDEDWTISTPTENLPPNQKIIEPIEDWGMTGKLVSPNKPADGWQMPEPKFRNSSGSSPEELGENGVKQEFQISQPIALKKLSENFTPENAFDSAADESPAIAAQEIAAPLPAIEAQPDILEVFAAAEIETPPAPPKKERSKGMRIFLIVFGIFAMFAFAVIFLVVIYFLFFYQARVE